MYTNIPTKRVTTILNNQKTQPNTIKEINNITHTVLSQKFFEFNNDYYKQEAGLAMGAPSSAVLSEIYLQYLEHNDIYKTLIKHKILGYFRYVNDILLIYDSTHKDINLMLQEFNNIQPNLQFRIEKEQHNKIDFLDITIQRTDKNQSIQHIPKTNDDRHNDTQYIMLPYTTQNVSHQLPN
jgi:hypothetical protein